MAKLTTIRRLPRWGGANHLFWRLDISRAGQPVTISASIVTGRIRNHRLRTAPDAMRLREHLSITIGPNGYRRNLVTPVARANTFRNVLLAISISRARVPCAV